MTDSLIAWRHIFSEKFQVLFQFHNAVSRLFDWLVILFPFMVNIVHSVYLCRLFSNLLQSLREVIYQVQ